MVSEAFQSRINGWVKNTFAPAVQSAQLAYRDAHEFFFQGILTPSTVPTEGVKLPPEKNRKPTDRPHDWAELERLGVSIPSELEAAIAIDTISTSSWRIRLHAKDSAGTEFAAVYTARGDVERGWAPAKPPEAG